MNGRGEGDCPPSSAWRTTRSEEETEDLGRRLGQVLPAGTTVGLCGPLGAGKTAFARGVASGLGIDPAAVSSPTFLYLVEYDEGRLPFVHADLYRFVDLGERERESACASIGLDEALCGRAVTLVEWWDAWPGRDPERLVRVELVVGSGDVRSIRLEFMGAGLDAARGSLQP